MSRPRTRLAAVAGSLALSLSLASAPVALAQDGPEATVEGLLAAIEAKDFDALPGFFCAEFASQAEAFDVSGMAAGLPPGVDANLLLDAIILDAEVASTEVVSQTDTEAVVMLEGALSMSIDLEALAPFIEAVLEASDLEATPELVEEFTASMGTQFAAESLEISEEITLVPGEEMAWVVCDELGATDGSGDMTDDGMTDDGMTDDDMTDDDMTDDDMTEDEESATE